MKNILFIIFKPFLIEYGNWILIYECIQRLKMNKRQSKQVIAKILEIDNYIYIGDTKYINLRSQFLEVLDDLIAERKEITLFIIKLIIYGKN